MIAKKRTAERRFPLFTIGLSHEIELFLENLTILLGAHINVLTALETIQSDTHSPRMRRIIQELINDVADGSPLWRTLTRIKLFPEHVVALIRIGEDSGRLAENMQVIATQQTKERTFRSKIRSALMYPVFVLVLTSFIGLGIAWFLLPRLATIFSQMHVTLPLITRILIGIGVFFGNYGTIALPVAFVVIGIIFYLIFVFTKTRWIGQWILFHLPGVSALLQTTELARMGFITGTLLSAGLPLLEALHSLRDVTTFRAYQRFYRYLSDSVEEGETFQKSFAQFKHSRKLIPIPVQQMLVTGEQSGYLPEAFTTIGSIYEKRSDVTSKNLAVILEPALLIMVWLGVVSVALAVILPIYSLIGGLNQANSAPVSRPPAPASVEIPLPAPEPEVLLPITQPTSTVSVVTTSTILEVPAPLPLLRILPTGTGFLNVRERPSTNSPRLTQILPGDLVERISTANNWFEIRLPDTTTTGWILGTYATSTP
ncbi:MAG: type II secretion system F family protein [Patescibacteria group bacterium]